MIPTSLLCSSPLPLRVGWTKWQKGWDITSEIKLQKSLTSLLRMHSYSLAHSLRGKLPAMLWASLWISSHEEILKPQSNNLRGIYSHLLYYYVARVPIWFGLIKNVHFSSIKNVILTILGYDIYRCMIHKLGGNVHNPWTNMEPRKGREPLE